MITVEEFLELFIDDSGNVCIYDCDNENDVFKGDIREALDTLDEDILEREVGSIDSLYDCCPTTYVTINI